MRLTIKKKIRLSNILTVLIPIAFTAIVIMVCLNTSLGSYWHTLVSLYSDENGVQFAHSIMANYQQELAKGKSTDWMVHMIGQAVGGYTNATHGMTLAAVSLPYYRYIMRFGLEKFRQFAINVWNVDTVGKTDEQVAEEGLSAMENWMRELGLVMNITELGATEEMIDGIADVTIILPGGYKVLDREEIVKILKESL